MIIMEQHESRIIGVITSVRNRVAIRETIVIDKKIVPKFKEVVKLFDETIQKYEEACIAYNQLKNEKCEVHLKKFPKYKRVTKLCKICEINRQHTVSKEYLMPKDKNYSSCIQERTIITCNACAEVYSDSTVKY